MSSGTRSCRLRQSRKTIARTKEQFEFKGSRPDNLVRDAALTTTCKGVPGAVELDFAMAGGFWGAVLEAAPGLADAARVTRASDQRQD